MSTESSYVIITPVKDEIENIEVTLNSVIAQTFLPQKWIILDDGSTDGTRELCYSYSEHYSWIQVVNYTRNTVERQVGKNVVEILKYGLDNFAGEDWDFWVKLDADITLPPEYFEMLLKHFDTNPRLGLASGQAYIPERPGQARLEWTHNEFVLGQARMYRHACWNDIGGHAPRRLWDIIDVYEAQMMGWQTESFQEIQVVHARPIDARQGGQIKRRFDSGINHFTLGYHPLYFLMRCIRGAVDDRPYILAGVAMYWGYIYAGLVGMEVYDKQLMQFVRNKQRDKLRFRSLLNYIRRRRLTL